MSQLWHPRSSGNCVQVLRSHLSQMWKKRNLVKVCRSKSNPRQPSPGAKPKRPGSWPVRQVGEETAWFGWLLAGHSYTLGDGHEGCKPAIKVHVEVDNCSVPMEVARHRCLNVNYVRSHILQNCGLGGAWVQPISDSKLTQRNPSL